MAIAGKVAITPKGDWNNIETYDKLDLVKYNNSLYIAKKSNQNIIPEDGDIWMLAVKSYDEEEFNKLITDVDDINRNLDIQGLLDKFDGKLDQAYYDVNNGTKAVHSDFVCNTNPISCNSGDSINFKLGIKPKNGLQIIYFNESGYVSGVTKYGTDLTFTAPSGATYFHFNYARSGGVTPTSAGSISVFINNEIEEINESLDTLEYSDIAGGKNIANPDNFEDGKVVSYDSGAVTDNSLYFISGYIQIEPSTKYTKQGFSSTGENWYYDENKNPISMITSDTFTTPSNAKYVVLSGLIKNKSICMLEKGSTPTTYEPYIPSVKMLASEVAAQKNDLDKLNSLPKGSIIQIDADKDDIETTTQKYGWQYLGTSNIQYENGSANILVTNVYRKNN